MGVLGGLLDRVITCHERYSELRANNQKHMRLLERGRALVQHQEPMSLIYDLAGVCVWGGRVPWSSTRSP